METVNKVYNAASHAVWGDEPNKSGEEPLSGETGQGTASDPYDAGNMEEQQSTQQSTGQNIIGIQNKTAYPEEGTVDAKHTFERVPARVPPGAPTDTTTNTGLVEDPSSGTNPFPKYQGAGTPLDKPSPDQEIHMEDRKSNAEAIQEANLGSKGSGPGGAEERYPGVEDASSSVKPSTSSAGQKEPEGDTSLESPAPTKSEAEAVPGEKHFKSSGFAAEGGDFDATQPGAGKEADRLLEHKGENVHTRQGHTNPEKENASTEHDANGNGNAHGKPKMISKMKDKLHIGKHHDVKV